MSITTRGIDGTTPARFSLPTISTLNSKPEYEAFRYGLETTYNLQALNPANVRWAEIRPSSIAEFPPVISFKHSTGTPVLSIALDPTNGGTSIAGKLHRAAMLVKDVQPWSIAKDTLGKYSITGKIGVPEADALFPESISLNTLISDASGSELISKGINDATPVIEAVVFLPFAEKGEFQVEFNPNITADGKCTTFLISQDRICNRSITYENLSTGPFMFKDEHGTTKNWQADRIPDLSALEKLLLPDSAGHMILISVPIKDEKPVDLSYLLERSSFGKGGFGDFNTRGSLTMGGGDMLRSISIPRSPTGATISGVNISSGSARNDGTTKYKGTLEVDPTRPSTIFHLRFIGVKPFQAANLDTPTIESTIASLNCFATSLN